MVKKYYKDGSFDEYCDKCGELIRHRNPKWSSNIGWVKIHNCEKEKCQ